MATATVNRIVMSANRKYVLDYTSGCVLGFSLHKLTNTYKGYCVEVQRQSDSATLNVGFVGKYVDVAAIEAFCIGTNGRVKTWYNEFFNYNAIQLTFNNMPIICTNGAFEVNGIKFVAAESTFMICLDYAEVQITVAPISYYANYNNITSHTGSIIAKNNDLTNRSIALLNVSSLLNFYLNSFNVLSTAQNAIGINKVFFKWETGSDNTKANVNKNEYSTAYNTTQINNTNNICIGARYNTFPAVANFLNAYLTTILIFNTNQYDNYNTISGGC